MDIVPAPSGLLQLLGDKVAVLNPRRVSGSDIGGGDVDCAVAFLDQRWSSRLTDGWRLCQCFHYDVGAWYWVLDRDHEIVCLDTIDDPSGLGRYGFPTTLALSGDRLEAPGPARAAYLTVKRLRKGDHSDRAWAQVAAFAREDPDAYRASLRVVFGERLTPDLAGVVLGGAIPDESLSRRAVRAQRAHRLVRNFGWLRLPLASSTRIAARIMKPTGFVILIVGPDGAGKSTLAASVLAASKGLFRRHTHLHWRPGLLPGLSSVGAAGSSSDPHARSPRNGLMSLGLLAYHWLDFLVGGALKVTAPRARSGLVVWERGWWDILVDPRRYRLRVPGGVVALLGRPLPRPDLVVVLEAPPGVVLERKAELNADELRRQTRAWRTTLPRDVPTMFVDAALPAFEVGDEVREELVRRLEMRTAGRVSGGWFQLRGRASERWLLPRDAGKAAVSALVGNRPLAGSSRLLWNAALGLASVGSTVLLPRAGAPPREVRAAVAPYLERGDAIAVVRSIDTSCFVVQVLTPDGDCRWIVKIAIDQLGKRILDRELQALAAVRDRLSAQLDAPKVVEQREGITVFSGISPVPRRDPWILPPGVAYSLGRLSTSRMSGFDSPGVFSQGSCTPWNLLRQDDRWVLVNWGAARGDAMPFFDVFHYLVEAHAEAGRPSEDRIAAGLRGSGWVGQAIEAYAEGAGLEIADAESWFRRYLTDGDSRGVLRGAPDAKRSQVRQRLLSGLHR